MKTVTYSIPSISCHHCVHTITSELMQLPGVKEVKASVEQHQAQVTYEDPASEEQIVSLLKEINYPPAG